MYISVVCPQNHLVACDGEGARAVAIAVDVGKIAGEFGVFQLGLFFLFFVLIVVRF